MALKVKLEKESRDATEQARLTNVARARDLEFEAKRLRDERHALADKEAELAAREAGIHDAEQTAHSTRSIRGGQTGRPLDL